MSTTRTIQAAHSGPVTIRTNLPASNLTVSAGDYDVAELTITTVDDEGPSVDAVNGAELRASGDVLECRLPRGGGSTMVQSFGGGSVVVGQNFGIVAGNVTGMVMNGGGGTYINGVRVSPGTHVMVGGSPIVVTARVPHGSSVRAESISGDVETFGALDAVNAASTSGDVIVDEAREVRANTTSGDISVARLTGTADLNSVSGNVGVVGDSTTRAYARTVSGNVRGAGGVDLDASTVSGRVRNR
jgi:hypothetical protein